MHLSDLLMHGGVIYVSSRRIWIVVIWGAHYKVHGSAWIFFEGEEPMVNTRCLNKLQRERDRALTCINPCLWLVYINPKPLHDGAKTIVPWNSYSNEVKLYFKELKTNLTQPKKRELGWTKMESQFASLGPCQRFFLSWCECIFRVGWLYILNPSTPNVWSYWQAHMWTQIGFMEIFGDVMFLSYKAVLIHNIV